MKETFTKDFLLNRRIAFDGYPPNEARFLDVAEYINSLEKELIRRARKPDIGVLLDAAAQKEVSK